MLGFEKHGSVDQCQRQRRLVIGLIGIIGRQPFGLLQGVLEIGLGKVELAAVVTKDSEVVRSSRQVGAVFEDVGMLSDQGNSQIDGLPVSLLGVDGMAGSSRRVTQLS